MRHAGLIVVCALALAGPIAGQQAPPSADKVEAISAAARKGDVAAVRALLDAGVDVNTKFRYDATALSYASDRGHVEVVKLLLERGADPKARDTFYKATPLTWAASPAMERTPRHAEVVGLLLDGGATGAPGALMAAVQAGDAPMVKVVLAHKDKIDEATVVYGDLLYVCLNNGVVAAYDVKTGARIYQERLGTGGSFSASPVAADGKASSPARGVPAWA